jgi:hypothetical protein
MSQSNGYIGIAAVLLGVVSLGLAIIPRAVFEVPPPWPSNRAPEPQHVVEGGKTIEWKGAKITIGGTSKVIHLPPAAPPMSSKVLYICTAVVALAGIAVGLIASWRDRSYLLGGPAVALCCVALLWHYILIGVAVAVAFVVIVMLLSNIAEAIPT